MDSIKDVVQSSDWWWTVVFAGVLINFLCLGIISAVKFIRPRLIIYFLLKFKSYREKIKSYITKSIKSEIEFSKLIFISKAYFEWSILFLLMSILLSCFTGLFSILLFITRLSELYPEHSLTNSAIDIKTIYFLTLGLLILCLLSTIISFITHSMHSKFKLVIIDIYNLKLVIFDYKISPEQIDDFLLDYFSEKFKEDRDIGEKLVIVNNPNQGKQ